MNKQKIQELCKQALLTIFSVISFGFASSVWANTYQVTNTNDCVAGTTSGSCPTGFAPAPGSLRAAIIAANNNPGPDVISFFIPGCGPNSNTNNVCTINVSPGGFPHITDTITINGSMPENRANIPGSIKTPNVFATERPGIELNGTNAGATIDGLDLFNSNGHLIKGLIINRFSAASEVAIFGLNISNTTIQGNYIGTDATGTIAMPNRLGIVLNTGNSTGTNITIGGLDTNQRNVVAASISTGIDLFNSSNSNILGNFVGTDIYGIASLGNGLEGIDIRTNGGFNITSQNNRIEYNLVLNDKTRSGIRLLGRKFLNSSCQVTTDDPVLNTVIVNNIVGLNLAGSPAPNFQGGLILNDDAQKSSIGFDLVNKLIVPMPNTFAANRDGGIMVISSAPTPCPSVPTDPKGHAMLYNTIFSNSTIGIDLTPVKNNASNFNGDGVTFNHPPGTSGPNNLQNYPVLDPVSSFANPALVQVEGDLDSAPNSNYLIQVFSNNTAVCMQLHTTPPAGYQPSPGCTVDSGFTTAFLSGQGHVLIGEVNVATDANGHVHFRFPAKLNRPIGTIITATATLLQTMPDGSLQPSDTSEFSQAIDVNQKGSANAYMHANGAAGGDNGFGTEAGVLDDDLIDF